MKIAIIGCGNMGSGMAARLAKDHEVFVYDRNKSKVEELANGLQCTPCTSSGEAVKAAEIIILAVKPQNLAVITKQIKKDLKPNQLIVSILAGTPISTLKQHLGPHPILRMMPNLAVIYGEGVIGLVDAPDTSAKTKKLADKLCKTLGTIHWLTEDKLDALAALTASGQAFVLVLIEAMVEAAVAMGFDSAQGTHLVLEMLGGTLTMLRETGKHPAELKWKITSPKGMTSAGLRKMEEEAIRASLINAFLAAYQRAQQMANEH